MKLIELVGTLVHYGCEVVMKNSYKLSDLYNSETDRKHLSDVLADVRHSLECCFDQYVAIQMI